MSFYAARAKADTKSKEMNREETRLAIERAKTTVNTDDMVDIEILEDFYQQKRWLKQELKNIRKRQREESTRIKMESHRGLKRTTDELTIHAREAKFVRRKRKPNEQPEGEFLLDTGDDGENDETIELRTITRGRDENTDEPWEFNDEDHLRIKNYRGDSEHANEPWKTDTTDNLRMKARMRTSIPKNKDIGNDARMEYAERRRTTRKNGRNWRT